LPRGPYIRGAITSHGDFAAACATDTGSKRRMRDLDNNTSLMTMNLSKEHTMTVVDRQAPKRHVYKMVDSPIGRLKLVATDDGLAAILWEHDRPSRVRLNIAAEDAGHPVLIETGRQLEEYFAGRRTEFTVKLDLAGTPFQRQVWNALLTIPFGETRSYGQIARQIGRPSAVRAVGAANGRNPVSIITPCHRVIGSTGKLTGFAGGLDVKAHLLALEGSTSERFASRP
jgi:methylated-DNA-[protein]-cysteine S-methyltransferase